MQGGSISVMLRFAQGDSLSTPPAQLATFVNGLCENPGHRDERINNRIGMSDKAGEFHRTTKFLQCPNIIPPLHSLDSP